MKKYAEQSEAKKNTEQLKEGLKSSILGPQNLGSGGPGPLGSPAGSASDKGLCGILNQIDQLEMYLLNCQ